MRRCRRAESHRRHMVVSAYPGQASLSGHASSADTEDAALLFQQMAELIMNYHTLVAPVRQIDIVLNLPLITTNQATARSLLPIDRLSWTERNATLAKALAGTGSACPKSGSLAMRSPRTEAGLAQTGLPLTQHIGKQLPPSGSRQRRYPDCR